MSTTLIEAIVRYRAHIDEPFHTIDSRAYTTGTVETDGTAVVTGTNTVWFNNIKSGETFHINGEGYYHIIRVDSNTQITLNRIYAEADQSGSSYRITAGQTTDATIVDDLNDSHREIVKKITELDENFFAVTGKISYAADTERYDLPTNNGILKKVILVERTDLSETKHLHKINFQDRKKYMATSAIANTDNLNEHFYLLGQEIGIIPIPQTAHTNNITIHYAKEATDLTIESSTVIMSDDYRALWIINAAIRRTTDEKVHKLHRLLWDDLIKTAGGRDVSEPRYVNYEDETTYIGS